MKIRIVHPKSDMQGNQRENIFIVIDETNQFMGSGYVFPKLTPEMTPQAPLNIFLEMHLNDVYMNTEISKQLYLQLIKRAKALSGMFKKDSYVYFGTTDKEHPFFSFLQKEGYKEGAATFLMEHRIQNIEPLSKTYHSIWEDHFSEVVKSQMLPEMNRFFIKQLDEESMDDMTHKSDFRSVFLYDNGRPVGHMILYTEADQGIKKGKIEQMYVIKDKRHMGIGSHLLRLANQYFSNLFVNTYTLEVWSKNERALEFYKKNGFKTVKITEFYLGEYIKRG